MTRPFWPPASSMPKCIVQAPSGCRIKLEGPNLSRFCQTAMWLSAFQAHSLNHLRRQGLSFALAYIVTYHEIPCNFRKRQQLAALHWDRCLTNNHSVVAVVSICWLRLQLRKLSQNIPNRRGQWRLVLRKGLH